MKSIDEFLKVDVFEDYSHSDPWVKVKGTNLLAFADRIDRYHYITAWYFFPEGSMGYTQNPKFDLSNCFSDLVRDPYGSGMYITMPLEDIIEVLPEELQKSFIFHIDLFR